METTQLKFIGLVNSSYQSHTAYGRIDLSPGVKYRLEHSNPLDPVVIDKVDRYHEDQADITLLLTPDEYSEIYDLLEASSSLYLEFILGNNIRQYNISEFDFPTLPDNGRQYRVECEMSIISRYHGSLPASIDSLTFVQTSIAWNI
jgi:hypothetical protein